MLAKKYRLTKDKEFEKVMKKGKAAYSPVLMLKFVKNDLDYTRVGVIVSNKVSKKAVRRNLARRRIREIIRLVFKNLGKGIDLVIIASPKILTAEGKVKKYQEIEKYLIATLKNSRILK